MKISYEMVQAMGGMDGADFNKFKSYCFTAFNILRKSANLILNLFSLMTDSNVQDIRDDPNKAVMKVFSSSSSSSSSFSFYSSAAPLFWTLLFLVSYFLFFCLLGPG